MASEAPLERKYSRWLQCPGTFLTMRNITTILFILLASCTRQSDTNVTTEAADKFDFTIKDGQIGNVKTGEQLTNVLERLKDFTVVRDSVYECIGCDTYSPLYVIKDSDQNDLFVFEPGWDSVDRNKLFRIMTSNKKFTTDRGIRVGMTVKELKEKYEIDEVDAGGESGVHVGVKGFKGSFKIDVPLTGDWSYTNKENISDTLRIIEIEIL